MTIKGKKISNTEICNDIMNIVDSAYTRLLGDWYIFERKARNLKPKEYKEWDEELLTICDDFAKEARFYENIVSKYNVVSEYDPFTVKKRSDLLKSDIMSKYTDNINKIVENQKDSSEKNQ